MREKMDAARKALIVAQLKWTAERLNDTVKFGLDSLTDDSSDYLKAAVGLSHDLLEEFTGGAYVDKAALRSYASDGVCPELHKLIEDEA